MATPTISIEDLIQHQGWLLGFVRRLVTDDFTADDIVQETFEQGIKQDRPTKIKRSWLAGVARNKYLERQRKGARRRKREAFIARSAAAVVQNSSEVSEMMALTTGCIAELPPQQQEVMLLRFMSQYSPEEIAAELSIPVEKVYRLTERGVRAVKEQMTRKYGSDWRSNCAAILGISLVPTSTALLKFVTSVAAAGLVSIGLWLGFEKFVLDPPMRPLEDAAFASDSRGNAAESASLAEASFDASVMQLDRHSLGPATASFNGLILTIVDDGGMPIEYSDFIIGWTLDDGRPARRLFTTDQDGVAYVQLDEDIEDVHINPRCPGFLNPITPATAAYPATEVSATVHTGSWAQDFRAVDRMGTPLSGVLLKAWRNGHPIGLFETSADGSVAALLPGTGTYEITMDGSAAYPAQAVKVDSQSAGQVIDILCALPPSNVIVRAVDLLSGASLADVSFTSITAVIDDLGLLVAHEQAPMPSSGNVLSYPGLAYDPGLSSIIVSAPGYQPVSVDVDTDTDPELVVGLAPLADHPARIVLGNPDRQVDQVTVHKYIRRIHWPVHPSGEDTTDFDLATIEVDCDSQGLFQLPQSDHDVELSFDLIVTDDLGQLWEYRDAEIGDLEADSSGVLQFVFLPKPQGLLTIRLEEADGTPKEGSTITTGFFDRNGNPQPDWNTDPAGELQVKVYAGEKVRISTDVGPVYVHGELQLPTSGDAFTAVLKLPVMDQVLQGDVLLANGEAAMFDFATSKSTGTIPLVMDGVNVAQLEFSVSHVVDEGTFLTEGLPAGQYMTTVGIFDGPSVSEPHDSGEAKTFHLPSSSKFNFDISDSEGNPIKSAWMNLQEDTQPGFKLKAMARTDSNGMVSISIDGIPASLAVLISARGYEPLVVHDPLRDTANEYSLAAGRELIALDTQGFGIEMHEGKYWLVDLWGDYDDPRQGLVYEKVTANQITIYSAPLAEFNLVEVDTDGHPTGRVILVP